MRNKYTTLNRSQRSFPVMIAELIIVLLLTMQLPACSTQSLDDESKLIHVVEGKMRDHYLIEYTLTADNLMMTNPIDDEVLKASGGKFEIYIKKQLFPITAANCKKLIILRMPESKSSIQDAEQFTTEKIAVYKKLLAVADGKSRFERVVIELNPYIKVNSESPLDVELMQCNVFFRSSNGRYIDYLGNLKE